jgi:azurin
MKSVIYSFSMVICITLLTACGGNQPSGEETKKLTATELFKDDRPAYDPLAIDPAAPVHNIEINATGTLMTNMFYDPDSVVVPAGVTVKLKLKNLSTDASMPHNWLLVYDGMMEVVANAGLSAGKDAGYVPKISDVLVASKLLGPLEVTELTFPAPPPGKYNYVCTYPGHWSIMNGVFIVQ